MSAEIIKKAFTHPETVAIVADNAAGYMLINAENFDAKKHKKYTGKVYGPGEKPEKGKK